MGIFQEAIDNEPGHRPNSKRRSVYVALRDRADGSLEEFEAIMAAGEVSSAAIARAIKATTGIEVSDSLVLRWRNKEWPSS